MVFSTLMFTMIPILSIKTHANVLQGCWQCQSQEGLAGLIFHSQNLLSFGGENYSYVSDSSIIRVFDGGQTIDCYYQTDGSRLIGVYADGSRIQCVRTECSSLVNRNAGRQEGGYASEGYPSGGDNSGYVPPNYDSGSWETQSDRQYYDDSAGYGGGASENPSSNYYEYD